MFDKVFGQPSARVVAVARLGLAAVFLLGTLVDPAAGASPAIIPILAAFLCFAAVIALAVWNDWWMEARTAVATHVIDTWFFVALLALPEGYSSPYFLFFVFLLLSTAIRRTWKDTALTAAAVLTLYLFVGVLLARSAHTPFEMQRFIIRSGYLLILSVVLIWFGIRRRFSTGSSLSEPVPGDVHSSDQPLVIALREVARVTGAKDALATWKFPDGREEAASVGSSRVDALGASPTAFANLQGAFLFDAKKDRVLVSAGSREPRFNSLTALFGNDLAEELSPVQGLGIPVRSGLGAGLLLLWGIEGLHSDHLALGDRLAPEIAHLLEHFALFAAMRDGAVARERLSLARDLHDGIVQFLAGSAYKVEAMSAAINRGSDVSADLQELKQLMLLEQEELRSSIGTLRQEKVSLWHTASEAAALCDRQSRHWRVRCSFRSAVPDERIPTRLHTDIMHIIKEGVANAVRHGSAQNIDIGLEADCGRLKLIVVDDGTGDHDRPAHVPWSIRERMTEAGGSAAVHMQHGTTTLLVEVPILADSQ